MTGKLLIHERRAAAVQTNDDPQKGSSGTFAIFAPFCANSLSSLGEPGPGRFAPAKNRANKEISMIIIEFVVGLINGYLSMRL
jgi:hypothetical protein